MDEIKRDLAAEADEPIQVRHTELYAARLSLLGWLLISIALAIGYTIVVAQSQDESLIWDWLHTLVATIVSVGLAVATGFLIYDRQQDQAAAAERIADLHVLRPILLEYCHLLGKGERQKFERWQFQDTVLVNYFDPTLFEGIARRGQHSPQFTLMLMQAARATRLYNIRLQHFFDSLAATTSSTGTGTHLLNSVAKDVEDAKQNLWALYDCLYHNVVAVLRDPKYKPDLILDRRVATEWGAPDDAG